MSAISATSGFSTLLGSQSIKTHPTALMLVPVGLLGHTELKLTRSSMVTPPFAPLILSHIITAQPCDEEGNFLPRNTPPAHTKTRVPGDWSPFNSRDEFELADLLFTQTEMSHSQVDKLMNIWATRTARDGGTTPFTNSKELHNTIDAIGEGDAPWYSFRVGYNGDRPQGRVPSWMDDSYQVFYRNPRQVIHTLLSNHKFDGNFDYVPYREYENNERKWGDFMSGNFCWKQAVSPVLAASPVAYPQ